MTHLMHILRKWFRGAGSRTLVSEMSAIPVVTAAPYRGNLALKHDRSQHRRYSARYEDLLN